MKKILFLIVILVGLFLFLNLVPSKTRVLIKNVYFNAEIAKTDKDKEVGLAKYQKIENDFALVFPFSKNARYSFWMKDMKFPIDIIYVNNGKIVQIFKNAPIPKINQELPIYQPEQNSDLVVEINAGLSDKYNFKEGDIVKVQK